MRRGAAVLTTAVCGVVFALVACGEPGKSAKSLLLEPVFSHVPGTTTGTCNGSDVLIEWTVGLDPDANANGHVCEKNKLTKRGNTNYDDKLNTGGPTKKGGPGKKK